MPRDSAFSLSGWFRVRVWTPSLRSVSTRGMGSMAFVGWLALVDEGVHALVRVLRRKEKVERLALEVDAIVDAALEGFCDFFPCQPHRNWRAQRCLLHETDRRL